MAKVSAVMLAVILAVGLGFVVARGASPPEHVYTVPQVLASLRALRGRTVLVRGVLVYGWVWGPRSALRPCQQSCGPIIYALGGSQLGGPKAGDAGEATHDHPMHRHLPRRPAGRRRL